jgi:hypothetical protein
MPCFRAFAERRPIQIVRSRTSIRSRARVWMIRV